MKNIKKIAAAALALSMVFGMTSCMGGGKLSGKKLAASAKKYGAEQIKDADDFEDLMEDAEDLEDGAYITASGSDLKGILKANDFTEDLYDSKIKSGTFVAVADDGDEVAAFIMSFTFGSKKDAESYYEDRAEEIEDLEDDSRDFDSDDGKEKGITYAIGTADAGWIQAAEGAYLNGNTVVVVMGLGVGSDDYFDFIDDIAGCYDIVLPSEL